MNRSRRYLRKLAGWVSGMPTYSSRWKTVIFSHGTLASAVRAARVSNCEAPVATTQVATPLAATAARRAAAASVAAAWPSAGRSSCTWTCMVG